MKILAIDFGKARTGLAICDKAEILASPLCVIPSYNIQKLFDELAQVISVQEPDLILVGKPVRTDGRVSDFAIEVDKLSEELATITDIPIEMYDERFTTVIATQKLHANKMKAKSQRAIIDAAAAAVLLQSYIDRKKDET